MTEPESDPFAHTRMTLAEHLNELRVRLFKGFAAVFAVFCVGLAFQGELVDFAKQPYTRAAEMLESYWLAEAEEAVEADPDSWPEYFQDGYPDIQISRRQAPDLIGIKTGEGFFFGLKVVFYVSLLAGGPILLWQLWQFVAAGLYSNERRMVYAYFPVSVLMLAGGVSFGFFLMVPYAIYFLNQNDFTVMQVTADYYMTFLTGLCMAFGVVFQLPLVLTVLGRAGVVTAQSLGRIRGHFLIGAFVFAAILTPPDPVTQSMLGVPLVVLYEVGILGVRIWGRPPTTTDLVEGEGQAA